MKHGIVVPSESRVRVDMVQSCYGVKARKIGSRLREAECANERVRQKHERILVATLMHSLSVVHFEPVLIGKQIRIQVVAHVRVTKFVDLSILTESFPVLFAIFLLNESIVLRKDLLPCESGHHTRVDTKA